MTQLKTGLTVQIIAGEHKGKTAKIIKMDLKNHKAMLEGIGLRERHLRATQFNPKGGKKTVHLGIDLSNLKLMEEKK
ncbi:MAG: KOW motif domain-containing protein [Candidatus Saccharibacteria bacterium]|nr:KOW motif domain-containing protein [Candidatus Saccharibacteria bacterium]